MKGLKDKKEKLKRSKLAQASTISPKQDHSREVGFFFSSNSPKQVVARLNQESLSPSPIRLNTRREA